MDGVFYVGSKKVPGSIPVHTIPEFAPVSSYSVNGYLSH